LIDRVRSGLQIELSPPHENVTDTSLLHHNVDDPQPDWISAGLVEQLDQVWESLNSQANACSVTPPRRTIALAHSTKLQREIELQLGDPPASQADSLAPGIKPVDESAETCRLEAERLFQAGEARAALEWAQRACSIQSGVPTLSILGRIQLRLVDFGAARISLLRAIELGPNQPLLQLHLANVEAASGDMKEALARAEAAIAMKPKNTTPFMARRGWLRRWNGMLDGAMDDFRNVLRRDPQHVDAWLGKISVYRQLAEFDQALNAADSLLDLHPDLVRAQTTRALVLMELGEYKEGVEAHNQAVRRAFDGDLLRARLETSYLPEMPTETARGNFLFAVAKCLSGLMPQDTGSSSDQTSRDS
jgi:tetratricopeptide (TPR) repeat protein